MTGLVEFLTVQLDDDEALAKRAGHTRSGKLATWHVACDHGDVHPDSCYECRVEGDNITIYDEGGHDEHQAAHIARHDPTRVLREVAAKRRILERHHPHGSDHCWNCVLDVSVEYGSPVVTYAPYPCPDLRDAIASYADRPGYKETWLS